MVNTTESHASNKKSRKSDIDKTSPLQAILIWVGVVLVFGWTLFLAMTGWTLSVISCFFDSITCSTGAISVLSYIIMFAPIAAGTILLPTGAIYRMKVSWVAKTPLILLAAIALFAVSYFLLIIALIAIHGIHG